MSESMGDFWIRKHNQWKKQGGPCPMCAALAAPAVAETQDEFSWSMETMRLINKLTPDIKGKALDPDWFLLRNRLEEFERAALTEAQIRRDEAQIMFDIFENWPTTVSTRRAMQQRVCGLQVKLNDALAAQAPNPARGDNLCQQGDHYDVNGRCTACGRIAEEQPASQVEGARAAEEWFKKQARLGNISLWTVPQIVDQAWQAAEQEALWKAGIQHQMYLCEIAFVTPHEGETYIFRVHPACEKCKALAQPYRDLIVGLATPEESIL